MKIDMHFHVVGREKDIDDPNAVLMKLIPSVQHINLQDSQYEDDHESLAGNNMPLLCHVGPEYSFPEGIREKTRQFLIPGQGRLDQKGSWILGFNPGECSKGAPSA